MGMNVLQDFSKVPTLMPKDGQVEADEDEEGGEEKLGGNKENEKVPTGKDALGDKGRLKAWFSS